MLAHGSLPVVLTDQVGLILSLLLIGLCFWAVAADLLRALVPNQTVLALFVLGLLVQGYMIFRGHRTWRDVLALGVMAGVLAVSLYLMRFWAPGDGKLFWALCLAAPVEMPPMNFLNVPVQILTWSLVIVCLYVILLLGRALLPEWLAALRTVRNEQGWWVAIRSRTGGMLVGVVTGLYYVLVSIGVGLLVARFVPVQLGLLKPLGVGLLLSLVMHRLTVRGQILLLALPAAVGVYAIFQATPDQLMLIGYTVPAFFLASAFLKHVDRLLIRLTPLDRLRRGSFLVDGLARMPSGEVRVLTPPELLLRQELGFTLLVGPGDGALTPTQVDSVQALLAQGVASGKERLRVRISVPFAPFMAMGTFLFMGLILYSRTR